MKIFKYIKKDVVFGLAVLCLNFAFQSSSYAADSLEGKWQLISIDGSPVVPGTTITAEYADGRIYGSAGCNQYFTSYTAQAHSIEIEYVDATRMSCGQDGVMEQEFKYIRALETSTFYQIIDNSLELTGGTETLKYVKAD